MVAVSEPEGNLKGILGLLIHSLLLYAVNGIKGSIL